MHIVHSQVKQSALDRDPFVSTPLGLRVADMVRRRIVNQPLSTVWDPEAAKHTPGERQPYDALIRNRQSQMAGQLVDLLQYGALAGGAYGLVKGIPKLLAAKKTLSSPETREEDIIAPALEKPAAYEVSQSGGLFDSLASGAGKLVDKATGALGGAVYGEIPKSPSLTQGPGGIPPGAMWPLFVGVPAIGAIGTAHLVSKLTDATRKHMIMRRKRELQKQFEGILAGNAKSASANVADKLADAYVKQADQAGAKTTAAVSALLTLLAGVGGVGGYRMAKTYSPGAVRRKSLEDALRRKNPNKPLTIHIDPTSVGHDAYAEPEAVSALDREEFNLPMPVRQKSMVGDMYTPQTLKMAGTLLELSNGIGKSAGVLDTAMGAIKNIPSTVANIPHRIADYGRDLARTAGQAAKPSAEDIRSSVVDASGKLMPGGGQFEAKGITAEPGSPFASLADDFATRLGRKAGEGFSGSAAGKALTNVGGLSDTLNSGLKEVGKGYSWLKSNLGKGWEAVKPYIDQLMAGIPGLLGQQQQSVRPAAVQPEVAPKAAPTVAAAPVVQGTQPAPPIAANTVTQPVPVGTPVERYTGNKALEAGKVRLGQLPRMRV